MHLLDLIRVAGFKSIRDQTLELRPLNVLIGANGAGKSNFIEVFRLLHEIVSQNLQLFVARSGGADRLLHFGSKTTEQILVHLNFDNNAYLCKLVPAVDGSLVFSEEQIYFQSPGHGQSFDRSLGKGHRETMLLDEVEQHGKSIAIHVVSALQSWKVYHFHDTSPLARVKQ